MGRTSRVAAAGLLTAAAAFGGCSATDSPGPSAQSQASPPGVPAEGEQLYPDVLAATLIPRPASSTFDLEVTISSPYDTPERYADGWRVLTPDGAEIGSHTLLHDHAGEQPFTRRQPDLLLPDGVASVIVEGRDLVNGYGGTTVEIPVPDR